MASYVQTDRPIHLTTPLGDDVLFLTEFHGRESLSALFQFELETVADVRTTIPFDALLGQKVTVKITTKQGHDRYFNGIVRRMSAGNRDPEFAQYRLEIVPQFWLLTRTVRSRIFQQMSSLEIIKKVLSSLDVSYEVQGDFKSREYCVQYQESDFRFASRLMEEEGIYYFFKHTAGGHTMVVANTPGSHPDIPYNSQVRFQEDFGYTPEDDVVYGWYKAQEIRTSKTTLWDEHFQLTNSGKGLPADKSIMDSVQVGKSSHKLTAGSAGSEIYEFPGEYSRHFDGINKSGGEQPDHLQWIFTENIRTAKVRIEQEAAEALLIEAKASHAGFTAGYAFELSEHWSDNGKFVITSVEHQARQPIGILSPEAFSYSNQFSCIPFALPFRPQRTTPIPSVRGVQLATVVGPPGEEIFPDKYSRVKVQFRWDRDGKYNLDSSCWLRVATYWAGKNWGAIHIPRIGQEVIVSFEEGDPDHPIIVGMVYNVDMMPPYKLPDDKTQSGIKSRSTKNGTPDNYNEIRFEDKKGSEEILVHAERDMTVEVERNRTTHIGKTPMTPGDDTLTVENNLTEQINNKQDTTAVTSIEIKCGTSKIRIDPTSITLSAMMINIDAQIQLEESALMTQISGKAMTQIQGGIVMIN